MKRRQIPKILAYVAYDNGLAGLQGRTAQSLTNRETWIRCRFIAALGQNHELVFDDLVNADPTVIPRYANHLHQLLHSFAGASTGQRERANFLKLLAGSFFHSPGKQSGAKQTERERDFQLFAFNACSKMMSAMPVSVPMDGA